MVRRILSGIGSVLLVSATPAKAAVTGTLALRGYVSSQALVRLAAPSTATALTFVSNAVSGNTATIRLSALANSAGGFTVSLGTSSTTATGVGPALLAEDGAIVPYQVSFGGKAVDLSRGEQQLVSITRDTTVNDGEDLQVVTPNSINTSGKRLTDHLILTIKAR